MGNERFNGANLIFPLRKRGSEGDLFKAVPSSATPKSPRTPFDKGGAPQGWRLL